MANEWWNVTAAQRLGVSAFHMWKEGPNGETQPDGATQPRRQSLEQRSSRGASGGVWAPGQVKHGDGTGEQHITVLCINLVFGTCAYTVPVHSL